MKVSGISLCIIIALATGSSLNVARAADREASIKQCVTDNKDEGQAAEAVSSYCSCMAGKMSASETASITDWEASHKAEMDACAAGANWQSD